jgi:ferredoxin-thioredoxin reductase catalytic subunit
LKITVNPNEKIVKEVRQKLQENDFYCPCKLIKNKDTKCMCKEFLEQKENGYCHCNLYYKTIEKGDNK